MTDNEPASPVQAEDVSAPDANPVSPNPEPSPPPSPAPTLPDPGNLEIRRVVALPDTKVFWDDLLRGSEVPGDEAE